MDYEHINPWLHIWIYPRKTIRTILETNPHKTIIWLAVLAGILSGLLLSYLSVKPNWSPLFITFFTLSCMAAGGILGLISLYFEGWLYTLTGSWIGGKGSFVDLKCASGWKNYPSIVSIVLNALTLWSMHHGWLEVLFALPYLIVSFWGFVILCCMIGEAHRFSTWKGLLTLLISMALAILFFTVIFLLIPLLAPLFQ